MATVSLCMIVKNEAAVLGRCLDSVRDLMDEIVIVDTGSTDATKQIASRYTDKIYDFAWQDDFSAARNESFSHATMQYCMWMDADDVLLEKDRQAFVLLKQTLAPHVDVVMMPYHTAVDEQGKPRFVYERERLLRRTAHFVWQGAVHEVITPAGNIVHSQVAVTHQKIGKGDPDRNLCIYQGLLAKGHVLDAREQFYYARELKYHSNWKAAEQQLRLFLQREDAWLENRLEAYRDLAHCLEQQGKPQQAMEALLHSLAWDVPRAETCCELGRLCMAQQQWRQAVYWYEQALQCPRREQEGGFVQEECYGYLPCIQLCVCYDHLGQWRRAEQYNQQAEVFRPGDASCAYNRKYFAQLHKKRDT